MGAMTRPSWAQRLADERHARDWTQQQTITALRMHADRELPDDANLLRMWKAWESGKHRPNVDYQRVIASTFGSVPAAIFGPDKVPGSAGHYLGASAATTDDTLELVQRIRRSDLDRASLDALAIAVERLCSEYTHMPAVDLRREGQAWMGKLVHLLNGRLTLTQHRELLVLAGWLALLIGCVEYDMNDYRSAEATRKAAASLGGEADHAGIMAWSQEMVAWFALTQGRYDQVIAAARAGMEMAPHEPIAVQLAAQEAKAWARIGDRRQVELALERGRQLLASLPYPDNVDNHFTVDPDKFDFYAMDCYRRAGEDSIATMQAQEVIRKSTAVDGSLRSAMRVAEARTTLAVSAARNGDLERAVELGTTALDIPRQSIPSLLMVTADLTREVQQRFPSETATTDYIERVQSLAGASV